MDALEISSLFANFQVCLCNISESSCLCSVFCLVYVCFSKWWWVFFKGWVAEAVRCLEAAIALFLEIGRLSIAARHYKVDLGSNGCCWRHIVACGTMWTDWNAICNMNDYICGLEMCRKLGRFLKSKRMLKELWNILTKLQNSSLVKRWTAVALNANWRWLNLLPNYNSECCSELLFPSQFIRLSTKYMLKLGHEHTNLMLIRWIHNNAHKYTEKHAKVKSFFPLLLSFPSLRRAEICTLTLWSRIPVTCDSCKLLYFLLEAQVMRLWIYILGIMSCWHN